MSQEQAIDIMEWWNGLSFPGKELFRLDDNGTLTLLPASNIKERVIATISDENKEVVLQSLGEKFAQAEAKVRELEVEWLAADDKLKLADKVTAVKEYLHQVAAIGNFLPLALLVHDWEHTIYTLTEENYAEKLKLAEQAESLAQNEHWKETTQAFKDIAEKWKQTGHADRSRSDKLWNRIEAARKTFQERKRVHHEEEEKDMLHNLDLKIDLVEQAEAIAASEEWKKTTDTFQRLTDEWKTIGHTMNKKNEELWQRFMTAKNAFFDRKRQHSGRIKQEQEKNYEIKLGIVERAEALKDSTLWNATTQAYHSLMDEWKKSGRASQEKGDELWKRFTEAKDYFFETKRKHFDDQKASLDQNYERKKALLDRAEQIKNSTRWGETTEEMNDLMTEWKTIGAVPRALSDKMWEDFLSARKHFFGRKDTMRDQRRQYAEEQKETRARDARNAVRRLQDDIKEEEEKIADFKNGLENITPGKKANELRAHLETLIAESTENLKRLQQKFTQAQNDINAVADKKATEAAEENKATAGYDGEEIARD